jgi:hypothetical protein
MNMQGLFLHILGDALGSVGVIISTLIIMFAPGDWRFYMDPIISLVITAIIISSTIPLIKSASFILLQGVPASVSTEELKREIKKIPGVCLLFSWRFDLRQLLSQRCFDLIDSGRPRIPHMGTLRFQKCRLRPHPSLRACVLHYHDYNHNHNHQNNRYQPNR